MPQFPSYLRTFHLVSTHLGGACVGGGGIKPSIHLRCVLHANKREGVQIACNIACILNGRPPMWLWWGSNPRPPDYQEDLAAIPDVFANVDQMKGPLRD